MFHDDERLALMIDGVNFHAAAKSIDLEIDYKALYDEFSRRGRMLRACYMTTLIEENDHKPLRPLIDWLAYNGFTTKTKSARDFIDANGRRRARASMDVEMTVSTLEMAPYIDHLVLCSGNSDLQALVEAMQRKGVRITVVSTMKGNINILSDELRRQADHFIDIDDIRDVISRKSG